MKHLEIEQLKKYGERRLSGEEMTLAVLHLDGCGACFDSFCEMFPALSDRAREVSCAGLTADGAEVFHLDYDEHLRPYIDFEVDEVMREIVESHLANCPFCARAVRELREFSDSLRLREISRDNFDAPESSGLSGYRPRRFSTGNFWRLVLPSIAVLILGLGGWLVWRQSETPKTVAEVQTPPAVPPISANENSFNRLPENLTANGEVKKIESPILPLEANSANVKSNAVEDKIPESNSAETERLLAALPPDFRAQFQNAVRTQKVNLPAFVAELRENDNLRGASGDDANIILAPNAQAVRASQPIFKWEKFAAGGESYIVTIYDADFNRVAVSPNLQAARWQSSVPLERGKIYKWQVKTDKNAQSYAAQFKVLDDDAIARLKKIENAAPNSPLVRGIGYAAEGLLSEAVREFEKEIKKNPRGNLAKKLKSSLVKTPKRRR